MGPTVDEVLNREPYTLNTSSRVGHKSVCVGGVCCARYPKDPKYLYGNTDLNQMLGSQYGNSTLYPMI